MDAEDVVACAIDRIEDVEQRALAILRKSQRRKFMDACIDKAANNFRRLLSEEVDRRYGRLPEDPD